MTISKALKVKARLIGQLKRLQSEIVRRNSFEQHKFEYIEDINSYKNEVCRLGEKVEEIAYQIVSLKSAIQIANSGISRELASLEENKNALMFWNTFLNTKSGKHIEFLNGERVVVEYHAAYTPERIHEIKESIQNTINELQDSIDEYNAKTHIQLS